MKKTYWFWAWLVQITVKKRALSSRDPKGEVWRNLVLISSCDEKEAVRKAIKIGAADQGDSRGSLRLDGQAAVAKFLGIEDMGLVHEPLEDGAEILFRSHQGHSRTMQKRIRTATELRASLKKELAPYVKSTQGKHKGHGKAQGSA